MGSCLNTDAITQQIETKLKETEKFQNSEKKLLFLGPGGSGKSTIFKQLQWLHGNGFSEKDAATLIEHIHYQSITQMQSAIRIYLQNNENKSDIDPTLQDYINDIDTYQATTTLTKDIATKIDYIWKNDTRLQHIFQIDTQTKGMQKAFDETTEYFWNDMQRISEIDYIPSKEDTINLRFRTTGIIQKHFQISVNKFHIFDVGGQKSERQKWIHCFDENVDAVVFVVSLSCYNEMMFEDGNKNCMVDSMELFDSTVNNKYFKEIPVILFLNKKDLFEKKIKHLPITCFENKVIDFNTFEKKKYVTKDPNNYEQCISFLAKTFQQLNKQKRPIFMHVTCAMDDQNVQSVFNDVTTIVVQQSLNSAGFD